MNNIHCDAARAQTSGGQSGWAAGLFTTSSTEVCVPSMLVVQYGITRSSMEAELQGLLLSLYLIESRTATTQCFMGKSYTIWTDCITFRNKWQRFKELQDMFRDELNLKVAASSTSPAGVKHTWFKFLTKLYTLECSGYDIKLEWERGHGPNATPRALVNSQARIAMKQHLAAA